jgi:arylsulfatase A-like enzyme/Flp pilus assembly protein TadD
VTRRRLPGFAALAWFGLFSGLCWTACTPSGPDAAPSATAEGADVLLITIDTLRADAVGFSGDVSRKAQASTPTLDRLAAAGRIYTDAHAHNVVTLPSHANILTGLYPWQHGVRDNSGFVLPESVPTLAARLKEAGYATAAFVGAYPLEASFGLNRGFDVYDDKFPRGSRPDDFAIAERRGDQVVAPALAWWNAQRGKRRFLWIHLYDPHAAYDPPEPFRSRFRDNLYQGEVAATDSFLAPLLTPLLDGGEPPALVVVTSDHGESLGEHGELTHGLFAYEATLKVPLVVWGPGVQTGKDGRPARHVDILPTVLGALGLEMPKDLPGRSLLAAADPQAVTYFESLTTHLNRGWAPLRGVIREGNKLIDLPLPELYNLARDPREETNLYAEERRTARTLQGEIAEESVWPPPKGQVTPEQEARLRSLGYSVGSAGDKKTFTAADDPKNLVELDHKLHQIVDLYSRGQYEQAVALGREMIAARPDLVEASEHLALSLRQLERHDEAIAVLQAAFARGSSQGSARESLRRQLGMALAEAGRPSEAVEMLRPLAGAGDAQTLNALGIALSDAGQPAEALQVLQQAAAKYPNDPKAHENLGIVMLRMEQVPQARDHLRRALELNPDLPIAWNTLGVALYRLEGPAAAIAAWERAVTLDPTQFDALYNIGLVAAQAGRQAEAVAALRRFVATAPPQRFAGEISRARQVLAELGS